MTKDPDPQESEMLRKVWEWRRAAYDASRAMSVEEREKQTDHLCRELDLDLPVATADSLKGRRKSA